MAAHSVQPTSDMIIWSRIRASRAGVRLAEVGGAQLGDLGLVVAELLGGVAELERRIVVAAVLPVDDPQPGAVVEEVVGEQVVVARDGRQRMNGQGGLDPRQLRRGARGSRPGSRMSRSSTSARYRSATAEHVEVVAEPRARRGAGAGSRRGGSASRAPGASRSTSSAAGSQSSDEDVPVRHGRGRPAAPTPASAAGTRVVQLVPAVDGEQLRRGARGSGRRTACRRPRPGSSCWSARPGCARRVTVATGPVRDRRDDLARSSVAPPIRA